MAAGAMIFSGEIQRVLYAFEHSGRGPEGWNAAEAALRMRHPEAADNSIRAVINAAHQVWQTGQNYRQGGAGYAPTRIPDYRKLEQDDPAVPPGPDGGRRSSKYWHEGVIEVRDPNRGGEIVARFSKNYAEDGVLTREEFERRLKAEADSYVSRFVNYDQDRLNEYDFTSSIRIEGVYRGF